VKDKVNETCTLKVMQKYMYLNYAAYILYVRYKCD